MKKIANKKVRKYKGNLNNGNAYKKVFQSYYISDYAFRMTYNEYMKEEESLNNAILNDGICFYQLRDLSYMDWYKDYKQK